MKLEELEGGACYLGIMHMNILSSLYFSTEEYHSFSFSLYKRESRKCLLH
jgi:hypothetical protein